jgi:hypothetical protein
LHRFGLVYRFYRHRSVTRVFLTPNKKRAGQVFKAPTRR